MPKVSFNKISGLAYISIRYYGIDWQWQLNTFDIAINKISCSWAPTVIIRPWLCW